MKTGVSKGKAVTTKQNQGAELCARQEEIRAGVEGLPSSKPPAMWMPRARY